MYRLFILLFIAGITFNCGGEPAEETTESSPATEEVTADESATVLNPNLASKEDLMALAGVDEALAQRIIDGRPFLGMNGFYVLAAAAIGESEMENFLSTCFVPLNLNSATEAEFKMVPGVGDKMAHEFEEYRPYKKVAQFRREMGKYVDDAEIARYEKYVFVPVALNTATDEEILAIPGVGDRMLHEFKEYRPYQSLEQFRREIGKYVDDIELERLEYYVYLDEEM
ncbi:MAG TPA: helix-hairpin-helix domain-containing protein [Saprospiraceae bacterium]|nr:helix-hairpin-helix domain-containing protein [Saprospiraceae bacterium]